MYSMYYVVPMSIYVIENCLYECRTWRRNMNDNTVYMMISVFAILRKMPTNYYHQDLMELYYLLLNSTFSNKTSSETISRVEKAWLGCSFTVMPVWILLILQK
jgi:hypothetical protein